MNTRRGCCAPVVHPDPVADANKLLVVEANEVLRTEEAALLAAVEEARQRLRACDGAAFAGAIRAAKKAEVRWR